MAGRDVGIEGVVKPRGRPVWRTSNNARKREPNNPAMRASRNAHSALKIAEQLRKLNDVRVRLAHHALEPGRALEILESFTIENINLETFEDDFDSAKVFPSLKPHENDTRMRWKKKAINLDEIVAFQEQLIDVIEMMTALMIRMKPIYLGPKQKLVAKIRELQQKVAQQAQPISGPTLPSMALAVASNPAPGIEPGPRTDTSAAAKRSEMP